MDEHLTLRLPRELARALARWARRRRVPKSQVAREAVAAFLAVPGGTLSSATTAVTAAQLADRWQDLPALTPEEAKDFASDVEAAARQLPAVPPPWG
jgi:predicted transcriptional regulator